MNPQPNEIYLAKFLWKDSHDERWWLVIESRRTKAGHILYSCVPLASRCYRELNCFRIDQDDPDFKATGLAHSCYVHYEQLYDLELSAFLRRRGVLQGKLLVEFRKDAGFPP